MWAGRWRQSGAVAVWRSMASHPLDHPAWSALTGRQAHLAVAVGDARRFDPAYGVFAALADRSAAEDLAALVAAHGDVAFLEAEGPPMAPGLAVASQDLGVQMVCACLSPETRGADAPEILDLGPDDAEEMLALALATEPGPFFARTPELGLFVGVRAAGRLVAMAGERMKPEGHTEVSGVCTLPEFRGQGLAGRLMRRVAARILDRGETPFLHAYAANTGAIALYESLGFAVRREVLMTRVTRAPAQG